MFSTLSLTGSGMLVLLVTNLLAHFNIILGDGQAEQLVTAVLDLAGIVMAIWGQLRRPDLTMGMFRKGTGTN
jgi:hypothetical protein